MTKTTNPFIETQLAHIKQALDSILGVKYHIEIAGHAVIASSSEKQAKTDKIRAAFIEPIGSAPFDKAFNLTAPAGITNRSFRTAIINYYRDRPETPFNISTRIFGGTFLVVKQKKDKAA